MNTIFALDASSNSTSHTQLAQLLCEKFRVGLKISLKGSQVRSSTSKPTQSTNTINERSSASAMRTTPAICGDVELRIGVGTQTTNMRRVNATRNNVLDLKEMRMVSTNDPPRTSPRRHQFGRHTRTTHAGIQDILAYFEIRQFQPRRGLLASTLTFCGYAFLYLNMELLLLFQQALQRTLDLVITQHIAIRLPGGRIHQHRERRPRSCLLYTSPSPRDRQKSRMPSSA